MFDDFDVRQELRDLAERAKALHGNERQIHLESIALVGELDRRNAAVNMGMTSEAFAAFIGLTINQWWKRAQAARVIRYFPKTLEMVNAGEIQVSHLSLLAPRITQANAAVLLAGIKNRSKREVAEVLSCVTHDGQLVDREPEIEVRVKLTKSQLSKLDRAREILSHSGHVPSLAEIVDQAMDELLKRRDPVCKAERAAARKNSGGGVVPSPEKDSVEGEEAPVVQNSSEPEKKASPPVQEQQPRPAIPAAIRHAVWRRDGGQCTWVDAQGRDRCPEKAMLELDHYRMWCRGGGHSVENMRLRCRRHNQAHAAQELGARFVEKWTAPLRWRA